MIDAASALRIQGSIGDQDTQAFWNPNTQTGMLGILWDARSDKAVLGGVDLQFQYTLRDVVDIVLGQVWTHVSTADGDQKTGYEQKAKALQVIRQNAQDEIAILEVRALGLRSPVVGQPTITAPVMPVPVPGGGYINPNSRRYRGDAVYGRGAEWDND